MKCKKCGMPILIHMKFMKNDKTGDIYCIDCFEELMGDKGKANVSKE